MLSKVKSILREAKEAIRKQREEIQKERDISLYRKEYMLCVDEWSYQKNNFESLKNLKRIANIDPKDKSFQSYEKKYKEIEKGYKELQEIIDGKLPIVDNHRINIQLKPNEVCHYKNRFSYFDLKSMPFEQEYGDLYITNQRIVYVGYTTVTYQINKIVVFESNDNMVSFRKGNEKNPRSFFLDEAKIRISKGYDLITMKAILRHLFNKN